VCKECVHTLGLQSQDAKVEEGLIECAFCHQAKNRLHFNKAQLYKKYNERRC